jgi:hypothetical protein
MFLPARALNRPIDVLADDLSGPAFLYVADIYEMREKAKEMAKQQADVYGCRRIGVRRTK